jgi:hypothetical protein
VAENIVVVMVLMAGSQSGNLFDRAIYKRDSPASCDGQHSLAFCHRKAEASCSTDQGGGIGVNVEERCLNEEPIGIPR